MKTTILIAFIFGLGILIFRPVPMINEDQAISHSGIVTNISEGTSFDIIFRVNNSDCTYYINRGLEQGLTIDSLKSKLLNRPVTFKFPKHWTPLDWNNRAEHLSYVAVNGEVIYSEFKD